MRQKLEPHKSKHAIRVVEIFEYFTSGADSATVMDIVKRYERPQSSTSELLHALVAVGLLYRDPVKRTYSPTPRLAGLGRAGQPDYIRNGRLYAFMNRIAQTTRHTVALFGIVGTHAQVFDVVRSEAQDGVALERGASTLLSSNAVGKLLLSALEPAAAEGILWRLHADAKPSERFDFKEAVREVKQIGTRRQVTGPLNWATPELVTAALVPADSPGHQLAVGVIYRTTDHVDAAALSSTLSHGLSQLKSLRADSPAKLVRGLD